METNLNAEAIEGWQPSNCCIAGNRTGSTHELHLAHCQVHCPQDSPIKFPGTGDPRWCAHGTLSRGRVGLDIQQVWICAEQAKHLTITRFLEHPAEIFLQQFDTATISHYRN